MAFTGNRWIFRLLFAGILGSYKDRRSVNETSGKIIDRPPETNHCMNRKSGLTGAISGVS
jgi:hypothetical protein